LARSNTASNGTPPIAAKRSTQVRTHVSARSSGTIVTSTHREYFSRLAKKWTCWFGEKGDVHVPEIVL